jgi:hypothetical protein
VTASANGESKGLTSIAGMALLGGLFEDHSGRHRTRDYRDAFLIRVGHLTALAASGGMVLS